VQDEDSFDWFILKAFQNKSQVGHFCIHAMFLDVIKRMKLKTNLVFGICLVVACGFMESPDMAVNKFRKPSIFQVGKCIINFPAYWLRMRRNRTQIWRTGGDGNLLSSRAVFFNRDSAEPQGTTSGCQGFRRNRPKLPGTKFATTILYCCSNIDTWIIA